ncbi:MAG: hypothetical protein PVH21_13780 [Myxococcales bacterium]
MRSIPMPFLLAFALFSALGCSSTSGSGSPPQALPEGITSWAPLGSRTVGSYGYDVIPEPDAFHTMHVGPSNGDNVWVAVAPRMELDWVAEPSFYVPEGPTFDNQGNLYFSPLFPQENLTEDIIGGISRYKPVRNDLLAFEATCAAGVRARNAAGISDSARNSVVEDLRQIRALIDQSDAAMTRAVADGDLAQQLAAEAREGLDAATQALSVEQLPQTADALVAVCNLLAQ